MDIDSDFHLAQANLSELERAAVHLERGLARAVNGLAYAVGWCVGKLRYAVFENLSLFEVLNAMSRGLDAATPKQLKDRD